MAPAVALPRLSQLAGMAFQVCLINTSSQCAAAVAKSASSTAIRKESIESQGYHMSRTVGEASADRPRMCGSES